MDKENDSKTISAQDPVSTLLSICWLGNIKLSGSNSEKGMKSSTKATHSESSQNHAAITFHSHPMGGQGMHFPYSAGFLCGRGASAQVGQVRDSAQQAGNAVKCIIHVLQVNLGERTRRTSCKKLINILHIGLD